MIRQSETNLNKMWRATDIGLVRHTDHKEKLKELKALVRSGDYVVDAWAIAESMLRRELLVRFPQPLAHSAYKHAIDA